jgi:hypothetical protein
VNVDWAAAGAVQAMLSGNGVATLSLFGSTENCPDRHPFSVMVPHGSLPMSSLFSNVCCC